LVPSTNSLPQNLTFAGDHLKLRYKGLLMVNDNA
jgi:hypothetical protein